MKNEDFDILKGGLEILARIIARKYMADRQASKRGTPMTDKMAETPIKPKIKRNKIVI